MNETEKLTGYPSIDKPWLKYYTKEQINAELPKCKIYDYVWQQNREHLANTALHYYGRNITYDQMFEEIEKTAKAFQAIGVKKGDIVAVVAVTLPETIYTFYGLNRIGAIANMIDPRTSVEGIKNYIEEVNAKVIVLLDAVYEKANVAVQDTVIERMVILSPADALPFVKKQLYRLTKREQIQEDKKCKTWKTFIQEGINQEIEDTPYQENECCVIVHTGGTTGMPKSVMLSNDNANVAFLQVYNSPISMHRGDTFLNIMPPFIAYGIILGIHTVLCCGWESVLVPKFDADKFDMLLLKYKPKGLIGVPSYYEKLMNSRKLEKSDLAFLKLLLAGGDRTPEEFEERINAWLYNHNAQVHLSKGYSMTEASATATASFENTVKVGGNGVPLTKTIIAAFKENTDIELSFGELGEICILSPTIMMGYFNNHIATDEVIRNHSDGSRWIHTGDLGYVDRDGQVYIEGRLKRMIIRYDGFKVFPTFIEKVILTNPLIEECCVVGKKDIVHGQGSLPFVFCVLKSEVHIEEEKIVSELRNICRNELPEYSQPSGFRFMPTIPLTAIGKADYRALEEILKE